jgi:pullulanase/glycogen debranching enzyme
MGPSFTLRDLVAYNDKHNEQNGEHNQDGANGSMVEMSRSVRGGR